MRICRVSATYPNTENQGIGQHPFYLGNLIACPTLILTQYADAPFVSHAEHVDVTSIKYLSTAIAHDHYSWGFLRTVSAYLTGQVVFLIKAVQPLVRFQPTVVQLHSPHSFLIGVFAKIFLRSKVVISFHGNDLQRLKKSRLLRNLLRFSDAFFYVSEDMLETLEAFYPCHRLEYTPSGVDLSLFKRDRNIKKEKIIVAVGVITWKKGFDVLIRAFHEICCDFPEYDLIVVGPDGGVGEELRHLISDLGLEGRVRLLGSKTRVELCKLLNKAEIFVLSSIQEGMPKVVLEALACELPIITTDVGDCGRVVGANGLIVPSGDVKSLSQAMQIALSDSGLRLNLTKGARTKALAYSWEENAKRVREIFRTLSD